MSLVFFLNDATFKFVLHNFGGQHGGVFAQIVLGHHQHVERQAEEEEGDPVGDEAQLRGRERGGGESGR